MVPGRLRFANLKKRRPTLAETLNSLVAEDASPGLLAAAVDDGGVRSVACAGVRKVGASKSLLGTDAIHIGSNAKAMTSTMLATLVADGVFENGWETTLGDVFPELMDEIHVDYQAVTLWQLITMAGGVVGDAADWWVHRDRPIVRRRYAILRENLRHPPEEPTGKYLYSNLSYVVAAAMAERVTGKAWETLMRERVFEPLGMASAGFGAPGTPGEVDQPWGHQRDSDSAEWIPNQLDNPEALGPAGGVHVSIADWAKFMGLWFRDAQSPILGRADLDRLVTPGAGRYAAGWQVVSRLWAGGTAITHTGSNGSWYTILWIAPQARMAFAVAANSAEPDPTATFKLLDRIVARLVKVERRRRRGDRAPWRAHCGRP